MKPVALHSEVCLLIKAKGSLVMTVDLQRNGRQLLLGSPAFYLLNEGLAQPLPPMSGIHPEQKNVGYPLICGLVCGNACPNAAHSFSTVFFEDPPAGGMGWIKQSIQRCFQVIPVGLLGEGFLEGCLKSLSEAGPIPSRTNAPAVARGQEDPWFSHAQTSVQE